MEDRLKQRPDRALQSEPLALQNVRVTDAFWQEKMQLVRDTVLPHQWKLLNDAVPEAAKSYCIHNFRAAAEAGNDLRNAGRQGREAGDEAARGAERGASAWKEFGDVASRVGAFLGGVAMIKGAVTGYAQEVFEISNMSKQLGVSMEIWQGWRDAAREMGADVEDLGSRMEDLGDWTQEFAKLGSGPLTDFAKATGESFKDATGAAVGWDEAALRIAAHLEKMGDKEKQAWLTNIGFDEKQISMFIEGRKKLEDLTRAKKEDARYKKEDEAISKSMMDVWYKLIGIWQQATATIMRAVGPAFTKLGGWLEKVGDWVENNGDSVIAWVVALAVAFAVALGPSIWGAMLPLLPFIALFVLLGAALDDLVVFAEGGSSAIEKFMEKMGVSRETIESVRSAVKKCIDFFKDLWAVITGNDNDAAAALERIRAKIEALKESFKTLFEGIGNWIANLFAKLSKALMDWIPEPLKEFLGLDDEAAAPAADASQPSHNAQMGAQEMGTAGGAPRTDMPQPYNAAALPPASPAALGPAGGQTVNNSKQVTTTVTVGEINVQSNSADPNAVAQAIPNELRGQVAQAETAFGT